MSWKSYTTHLLFVVAVLVVGPSAGIVAALPICNAMKPVTIEQDCPYTEQPECLGRERKDCNGDGDTPQKAEWGDCKASTRITDYCFWPQQPVICYAKLTCVWDPMNGICKPVEFLYFGWWTTPQTSLCDLAA